MGKEYRHLTLEDFCTITRLREGGESIGQISAAMGSGSIIDFARNNAQYRRSNRIPPALTEDLTTSHRCQGCHLKRNPELRELVLNRLAMKWSPEQISGRLALKKEALHISYTSIYRFIHPQVRRKEDYS